MKGIDYDHGLVKIYLKPGINLYEAMSATRKSYLPSDAHKFNQRTFHVRLINLCTSDKKSSHKIRHKETPRVHDINAEDNPDKWWEMK